MSLTPILDALCDTFIAEHGDNPFAFSMELNQRIKFADKVYGLPVRTR